MLPLLLLSAPFPADDDKVAFGTTKGSRRGCSPLLRRRLRCCRVGGFDAVIPVGGSPFPPAAGHHEDMGNDDDAAGLPVYEVDAYRKVVGIRKDRREA